MSIAREYIKGDTTIGQGEAWESICDLEHDRDKAWKLHAKAFARVKELEAALTAVMDDCSCSMSPDIEENALAVLNPKP